MSGYRFRGGAFLFFLVSILLSATGAEAAPTVSAFKINNGAARTVNPTVTLPNVCAATSGTTLAGYMASESSDFTSATWRTYASVPMFTLSSGSGEKAVYFKVKNSAGEESAVVSDAISLVGTGLSVVSWGKNDFGQCTDPESNSGFVSVAVGWKHNVGLKPDGTIVAWGHNDYHQIEVPSSNSGFVVVGAGAYHSLGIKSDGSVVAWGRNSEGQCNVPSPNSGFVAVAAGYYHSVGLKSDGSVVAWGSNQDYNGNYSGQCVVPAPNSGFVAVSAGLTHTLGLKADGSIVAWGTNRDWLGNDIGLCVVPSPNSGFVAIASGYFDNLALKSDGSIVTWGITVDWERKNINLGTVPSPNSGFVAIASGPYHHMGLKSDGSITAWGRTAEGQCTIPAPNSGYATIAGGGLYHSVALVPLESVVPVVSSFSINNGAARTVNPTVTLPNVCAGATASSHFYMASESSDFTSATWKPYASVPMFTLSSGSGEKTVYFKVKNSAGVESAVVSDSIQLDSPGAVVAWGSNYNWDGSVYTGQCNIPSPNRDYVAVAAGWGHSAALKVDGSIVTWGYNQFGQCNVPSPNRDFVAVAAVDYQTLGLKSDGSIVVWGYNNSGGQSAVPAPNRDYVAISAVRGHSLALKSDGSVVAWGINTSGQCNVPSPNTGFVAVSAGFRHSLALKADGSVLAWGADQDYYNPQYTGLCAVPAPNSGFRAVSAGGGLHNLGLKSDGSVVAWGSDYDWLGQYIGACAVPAPNSGFVAVSGGNYHSLGLKSDGSIVAWGKNNNGECNVPAPNSGFTAIVGGGNHSLALVSQAPLPPVPVVSSFKINNGAAKTVNPTVTLPNVCAATLGTTLVGYMASESPDFTNAAWLAYAPVPMFTLSSCSGEKTVYFKVKNSAGGESAVVSDTITRESPGRVVAWGKNNDNGQVSVPTNNEGFVEISAGWTHSAGLKSDGSIVAWGLNDHGISTVPSPNRDFVAVSAGAYHTLGLKSDGSIVAWGVILKEDRSGYDPVTTPTPNSGFVAISTGMHHCLGLKADGSVVAWGLNDKGQTTLPVPNSGFVAIAAGVYHSLGLKSDGSVVGWGSNLDFQGNPVNQCQAPLPNSGFVSIAAGQYHSLGLKSDGSVVAWGSNTDWLGNHAGQCEIPPSTLPFVSIARGSYHSLGVKSDGSAVAWGWNEDYRHVYAGQCDVPSVNGRYVAVAGGGYHSLGLVLDNRSQLAVVADPTSGGTVSKSPDLASYTPGTVVTLQATPAAGWLFVGWMDGTTTVSTNVSYACVVGSSNKTITAKFEQILLPDEITVNLPGNVPLTLIQIPAGSFQMGSPDSERSHRSFEGPVHTVHINYPFYMGKYELTQGQWQAIMGDNPAAGYGTGVGDNYPVNMVFLENIRNTENGFLRKLNDYLLSTGQILTPMRLPSEAEWEYACRGGTQTRFYFGDSLVDASGNPIDDLNQDGPAGVLTGNRSDYMWWSGNSGGGAKPVGTKRPNQFGLYDMHGNVSEWVLDTWSNDYTGAPTDGSAWINPDSFYPYMLRGGSWEDDARYCRSASRFAWATDMCMPSYGFRLLMCPGNSIPKQYALSISVWGSGSVTKSPDLATYTPGTVVTLQATPAPGWSFVGWMDGVSTTTVSTSSVYMYTVGASDTTFTARFVAIPEDLYALTLDTDPVNGGAVSKNPDFSTYAPGTSVTLQATPAAGWVFAGWWDGNTAVSSGAFFLYSMPASSKVLTARFRRDYSYVLTLVSDPADGGALSKNPDFSTYAPGTSVTLQATPAAGWVFAGWWDGNTAVSSGAFFLYSMPASSKVLTARFLPDYSYVLTLASDPADGGALSKNPDFPTYAPGTSVTLLAIPAAGWAFASWWDGISTVSTDSVFTYTMPAVNKVLTAHFRPHYGSSYTLTLVSDPVNGGTVSKSPDHPSYTPGDPVTLWATPASGWAFAGWWDGTTTVSRSASYTHTVGNSDQTIIARFVKVPDSYRLTVIADPADMGTVMKDPDLPVYAPGTQVTLTAQANAGYCFDRWTGDVSVTSKRTNPVTITMDSDRVVGVEFLPGSQPPAAVLAFSINNGAIMTANPTVTLPNTSVGTTSVTELTHYMVSESADFTSATWQPYARVPMFTLSSGSGVKTVYFKVMDSLGAESAPTSDTIQLGGTGYPMVGWGDNSWGNNEFGQNSIPAPNSGFLACAAGYAHSLGLKSDGSIVAWGSNGKGQCNVSVPNSGFIAVAAGGSHSLGLRSNGSIAVWGNNEFNQWAIPVPNNGFVAVAAGLQHCVGLKSNGSVVVWGNNEVNQCAVPTPNRDFVAITAGYFHTLALKSDGSIVTWGDGKRGECSVPSPNANFVSIGAGAFHSLGVKSNGSITAFGLNGAWQCLVPDLNNGFMAVSGGLYHSLGLKSDGTLVPWGSNLYHQGDIPNSNIRFEAIFAAVTRSLALVYEIGTLTVTLETPEAVAAGAQWRLADEAPGVWHNSGETITPQVGVHTVTFKNVYGWLKPADQQIDVTGTGTAGVSGLYTRSLWRLSTACSNGSIQVSPAGTHFPYGTRVTLTAQPQTGYGFDRWTGDVPTELKRTNPVTLVMDSDRAIGVEFEEGRPPASAVLAFSINNGAILTANPTVTLPNTSVGTTSV
ncbi:MAG TPA: SUMF1/EgtB/PvdO family nonheme iron enzyme, partial [Candidatus Sumerlaeota bacterium]|nr:SUMF1/EgtB/PvdO family nonheme iron enzyme [Candidatus Sumerlaeota bacterium]